jgi:hypothetical protein
VAGFYERNSRLLDSVTGWERLLAYQNGICSVELVNAFNFHIYLAMIMAMGVIVQ